MTRHSSRLSDLRARYVDGQRPLPRDLEQTLRDDARPGARRILAAIDKRRSVNRAEGQRLRRMLRYERALWGTGTTLVAGVDEAGMSPLAGPVVAAAVILAVEGRIEEVDDSKRLSAKDRARLALEIKRRAIGWAVGQATNQEIDRLNIYHAGLLAMRRAVEALDPHPEAILVDARVVPETPLHQRAIIKGDQKSLSVAAASVLAKTTRDALMISLDRQFPGYGLARHKGYPVAQHREAIRRFGPTSIHRRSFPALWRAAGQQRSLWSKA